MTRGRKNEPRRRSGGLGRRGPAARRRGGGHLPADRGDVRTRSRGRAAACPLLVAGLLRRLCPADDRKHPPGTVGGLRAGPPGAAPSAARRELLTEPAHSLDPLGPSSRSMDSSPRRCPVSCWKQPGHQLAGGTPHRVAEQPDSPDGHRAWLSAGLLSAGLLSAVLPAVSLPTRSSSSWCRASSASIRSRACSATRLPD